MFRYALFYMSSALLNLFSEKERRLISLSKKRRLNMWMGIEYYSLDV